MKKKNMSNNNHNTSLKRSKFFWAALSLPLFTVSGVIIFVTFFVITQNLLAGLAAGAGAGFLCILILLVFSMPIISRLLHAKPINLQKDARFAMQIENLCLAHGFNAPKLLIIKSRRINVLSYGIRRKNAAIAITIQAQNDLNSIELEALLVHQLSKIQMGITGRETYAIMLLRIVFARIFDGLLKRFINPDQIIGADIYAMGLTRYPPGLIQALQKMPESPPAEKAHIARILSAYRYGNERLPVLKEFWNINI